MLRTAAEKSPGRESWHKSAQFKHDIPDLDKAVATSIVDPDRRRDRPSSGRIVVEHLQEQFTHGHKDISHKRE
jgi:hypothetical protein